MRTTMLVSLLLAFICSLALAAEQERTVDIFAWPLSAPKSASLAKVSFNSTSATVKTYNPPSVLATDDVVRVGFYHPSGPWSGVATSARNFAEGKDKKIQLHVNSEGELVHVGFTASDYGTSSKTSHKMDDLSVEVVRVRPGPTPRLNKPVVVNADGSVPEKEPEKTFLQK
jgi:hypothetical protein